nr:DNA-directed RNA polymerase I chain-like protein [Cryptomonas sp.]
MDIFFEDSRISDITSVPRNVSFSFYSSNEINMLSSTEIICPVFFDNRGKSIKWGLCDSKLGSVSKYETCVSCYGSYSVCPGHFGHIELAIPISNPLIKNLFLSILNAKCWYCNFFRLASWKVKLFYIKLLMLDLGLYFKGLHMEQIECLFSNLNTGSKFKYAIKIIDLLNEKSKIGWLEKNIIPIVFTKNGNRGKEWKKILQFFLEKSSQLICCQKCKKNRIRIKDKEVNLKICTTQKKILKSVSYINNTIFDYVQMKKQVQLCLEKKAKFSFSEKTSFLIKSFQIKKGLCDIWNFENDFCELIWGDLAKSKKFRINKGHEKFFVSKILVPPTRFRPVYFTKLCKSGENMNSNPKNFYLLKILKINQQILLAIGLDNYNFKKHSCYKLFSELEIITGSLFDNSTSSTKKEKINPIGIRQQLEQKFGLFRMHLMGKRVYYSARSVVVPDPFLKSNEVGFPKICANKMIISVILNQFGMFSLQKLLKEYKWKSKLRKINIKMIETIFGEKINISEQKIKFQLLQLIQICKKYFEYYVCKRLNNYGMTRFFRNLISGDFVLLNRQPSLHRASVMAHSVVVKKKTRCLSLNYINCTPYNADFDGDEMNVHIVQNNLAKAEALILSMANNHTKIPTHSTPIRSLIQDQIISAVSLTSKNSFFNKNSYFHLIGTILSESILEINLCCPAVVKPKNLWTGKQIISIILKTMLDKHKDISLESKNKIPKLVFGQDENVVLFRNGELLRGVLDSTQLGKNKYGIIHAFHEKHGALLADKILSALSSFFIIYQRMHGHTAGLEDLITMERIDKIRTKAFIKEKITRRILLRQIISKQGFFLENINKKKKKLYSITNIISFLYNQRNLFTNYTIYTKSIMAGISANLIENNIPGSLEKNIHLNGFLNMTLTGAKGSSVNIFQICSNLGQTELEGKCIPRGHGAKTLPGFFPFDISAKANGFIIQRFLTGLSATDFFFHCMAGREGLLDTAVKTSQSGYIQRSLVKHLESLKINYDLTVRQSTGNVLQIIYSETGLSATSFDFETFLPWYSQNISACKNIITPHFHLQIFGKELFVIPLNLLYKIQEITKDFNKCRKIGFPVFQNLFLEQKLLNLYQKNLGEPGELVGIIASQSIGEPCTQMTLNTFHFAGKIVSSGNQGIPRLREILLIASKYPKNPTMSAYFQKNLKKERFFLMERRIKKIFISDLMHVISTHVEKKDDKTKMIIRIRLCSKNSYKHQFSLNINYIVGQFKKFLKNIYTKSTLFQLDVLKKDNIDKLSLYLFKQKGDIKLSKKSFRHFLSPYNLDFESIVFFDQTFCYCIREIPRISSSFIDFNEKAIHLEGTNFFALWANNDLIDLNKIYSNDIYALLLIYGIEASRKALFSELETIFQFHAILINKHHIDLISDYMTRMGDYRPFNRMGMYEEKGFQKITYETALHFITEAAIDKTSDKIVSASSSICTGKLCNIGTGCFDILYLNK